MFAGVMTAWTSGALDGQSPEPVIASNTQGPSPVLPPDHSTASNQPFVLPPIDVQATESVEPLVATSRCTPEPGPTVEHLPLPRPSAVPISIPAPAPDLATVQRIDSIIQRLDSLEITIRELHEQQQADRNKLQQQLTQLATRLDQVEHFIKLQATPTAIPPALTATLHLANDFDTDVTIIVNTTRYPLAPGKAKSIAIPAGGYTFRVLPWHTTPQPRTIAAGEERPIRVFRQKDINP